MTQREDEAKFVAQLMAEAKKGSAPHLVARDALAIMRDAARLQTLALRLCNAEIGQEEYDRRKIAPRARIAERVKALGLPGVDFEGDPRGYVVKLHLPSKASNNMGGEHWGVPVRAARS